MKKLMMVAMAAAAATAPADTTIGARELAIGRQVYAEMQRVSGQVDVMQATLDDLSQRGARVEGGKGEAQAVRGEIDSLKAEIAAVRREMQKMRQDIVSEMTQKVIEIVRKNGASQASARAATPPAAPSYSGPCKEYVVEKGDTLSMIAQAFRTTVPKLREMNGLKNDNLRIGQKLLVPKN